MPVKHGSAILPIAFFAFTWLPRAARQALLILAVQAAAVLANLVSLYVLERQRDASAATTRPCPYHHVP